MGLGLEMFRGRASTGEWQRSFLSWENTLFGELPDYTASADLGVVLTQDNCLNHHYSLPNKLFEYLHAGLPVICSDLPEIARIVQGYQVGELTDPDNPSDIAQSIKSILSDPPRFLQMKINTKKAAEDFNWDKEKRKLITIYQNLGNS